MLQIKATTGQLQQYVVTDKEELQLQTKYYSTYDHNL